MNIEAFGPIVVANQNIIKTTTSNFKFGEGFKRQLHSNDTCKAPFLDLHNNSNSCLSFCRSVRRENQVAEIHLFICAFLRQYEFSGASSNDLQKKMRSRLMHLFLDIVLNLRHGMAMNLGLPQFDGNWSYWALNCKAEAPTHT